MSSKKWDCLEVYAESFEALNSVNEEIVVLLKQLKNGKHLELYFFNRYSNSGKNEHFLKVGLVSGDEKALSDLDVLLKKRNVRVKHYDCELWEVDGFPIDFIKCISCELYEKIREGFPDKPLTLNQLGYLLHFLMNQLGVGYENELELYKNLK